MFLKRITVKGLSRLDMALAAGLIQSPERERRGILVRLFQSPERERRGILVRLYQSPEREL